MVSLNIPPHQQKIHYKYIMSTGIVDDKSTPLNLANSLVEISELPEFLTESAYTLTGKKMKLRRK